MQWTWRSLQTAHAWWGCVGKEIFSHLFFLSIVVTDWS